MTTNGCDVAPPVDQLGDGCDLEWRYTGVYTASYRGHREAGFTAGYYTITQVKDVGYQLTFIRENNGTVEPAEFTQHIHEFLDGTVLYRGANLENAQLIAHQHYVRIRNANHWLWYSRRFAPPVTPDSAAGLRINAQSA